MKSVNTVLFLGVLLTNLAASAIPHEDCTAKLQSAFAKSSRVDNVQKISFDTAINITSSEGLLKGRDLRSAQLELGRAKQIYAVYTTVRGGSATDLVTTERTCTVRKVIRIQEE